MVNNLCQLGWATVPRYLVKHSSECALRVFWGEINIWTNRLSKASCLPLCGRTSFNQFPEQNKRLTLPLVRENSPCLVGLQSGASALPYSTAAATLQTQARSLTLQILDLPASIYHLSVCLSTYLPIYLRSYLSLLLVSVPLESPD